MFCDECFGTVTGADSACLQVQTVEQKSFGGTADYRDYCGPVESGGFARDAGGESAADGSRRPKRPGQALQGLRCKQENDSARVSGRNEDEFREVATATAAASWVAVTGFRRKGDGSGLGGGL